MSVDPIRPPLWPEIRALLLAAMVIFTYTIGIGILNGTDIVDFDQRRILGHVHGGTLGWLTLAVFAASLWLFGEGRTISSQERNVVRVLGIAAVCAFALYVVAFSTTYGNFRPIMGAISTVVIAGMFLWVANAARRIELGVPHIGFLAALGTSIVGGVLGVLLGLEIATGDNYLPDGGEDAHPATMVVGFLIPVALSMAEWAFYFPRPPRATRAGLIQMVFPFLGGVVLMLSLLLDITPLAPIAILLEVVGIIIFLKRMWPNLRALDLTKVTPGLHGAMSAVAILFVVGLAQYFIIRYDGDFDNVPDHQLLALDHAQFIGAMTNAVFAMLLAATASANRDRRLIALIFIMVNVGMIGFVAGLLFDVTALKRTFAPIMGTGLLIGLVVYAIGILPQLLPGRQPSVATAD